MPTCYIFTKATGVEEDHTRIIGSSRRYLAHLDEMRPPPPTWEHVCASLTGEYHFFLKFRYAELYDVACAVLRNRRRFSQLIVQTLTMLEYPVDPQEMEKERKCLANASPTGMILLQDKMGAEGFRNKENVLLLLQDLDSSLKCADVFGPFDYIVEFHVGSPEDFETKKQSVQTTVAKHAARAVFLYCKPFYPDDLSLPPTA